MSDIRQDLPQDFPEDPADSVPTEMPEIPKPDRRITIGMVVKAHGLKGDLKIQSSTWRPERFTDLKNIWLEGKDGRVHWLTPRRVRIESNAIYIRFKEAPVREYAQPLIGGRLFVDEGERDKLPEDLFYIDDLIGCKVTCSIHGDLGTIVDVMDTLANDVWQVNGPRGEVLIPAIQEMVDSVDIEAKQIQVTLLDGLLPSQQREADRTDPELSDHGRGSSRSRTKIKPAERPDESKKPPDDH